MFKKLIELIKLYFSIIKKVSNPNFIKEYIELQNKKNIIEKNEIEEKYNEINENIDYSKYYKKNYIMTQAELKFYRELKKITDKLDLIIFTQVDLERIINVKNNIYSYRNRIKSRSIDFTIVDNKNCKIICCIELDDYTHNNPERIKRDIFINELFNSVGLKLYRYNLNTDINIIENNIKQESILI